MNPFINFYLIGITIKLSITYIIFIPQVPKEKDRFMYFELLISRSFKIIYHICCLSNCRSSSDHLIFIHPNPDPVTPEVPSHRCSTLITIASTFLFSFFMVAAAESPSAPRSSGHESLKAKNIYI
ncbi:hypothetical protein P3X46_003420 [Hevea brasiliensis]|uniref:Uncharacterized protein n=1 Tax=Hevea brasiliensis TaxID=3981 RepID=A0ABQ9NB10_HEVBR|nr:hypothetical protein P3X46_003420 [Hevea brasiliensis]